MGRYTGKKCRLLCMIALTASFMIIELVVGYVTNSMALVADSFHMLSDVVSIVIAFISVKISPKKWSKNTFGWARAEVLGALVNSVFLVALCFSILIESIKRFIEIEVVHDPVLMLIVGGVGLFINIIGLVLFHEHGHGHSHGGGSSHSHGGGSSHSHGGGSSHSHHSHAAAAAALSNNSSVDDNENDADYHHHGKGESKKPKSATQLNMKGVYLHVMADALGSVIVIISALVIWLTDWEYRMYIDPALSVVLVLLIMRSTWPLLRESALILLQTVPTHIQLDDNQRKLLTQVDGVLAVHEFHVWQLAGDRIIASAHIRCRNLSDYMKIAEKVKEFFHNEGIHSTTIQPEFTEIPSDESVSETESCALDCPAKDRTCAASTCCGPSKQGRDSPQQQPAELVSLGIECRQRTTSNCACGPDGDISCAEQGAHSALIANNSTTTGSTPTNY